MEIELADIFNSRPDVLDDKKTLERIFADYYNGDEAQVRRMIRAYETGILDVLADFSNNDFEEKRFLDKLVNKYDMQEERAKEAIEEWHNICPEKTIRTYSLYHKAKVEADRQKELSQQTPWNGILNSSVLDELYEEGGNRSINLVKDILASPDIEAGEKEALAKAFSENIETLVDSNYEQRNRCKIYEVSLKYIDSELSKYVDEGNLSSIEECNRAIKLCRRQYTLIKKFAENKWKAPRLKIVRPERIEKALLEQKEVIEFKNKMVDDYQEIESLLQKAETELTVESCDAATEAINAFEKNLESCHNMSIELPYRVNNGARYMRKAVLNIRSTVDELEDLQKKIYESDQFITGVLLRNEMPIEQYEGFISVCKQMASNLRDYGDHRRELPNVKNKNPEELASQYAMYWEMKTLDGEISAYKNNLIDDEKYEIFFEKCSQLVSRIKVCIAKGWKVPELVNTDPSRLASDTHAKKKKKEKWKKFKRNLILGGILLIAIAILGFLGLNKYREGKVRVPFDPAYAKGKDVESVYSDLESARFENITKTVSTSGWLDDNKVLSVTVDNSETYSKGKYVNPNVKIEITYSSDGRTYVTDLLKNWKKTNHEELNSILKDAGFDNVSEVEVTTSDKSKDQIVAELSLNGELYTNEYCYLPLNAPIVITYNSLKLGIGNDNTQLIGQDYREVVSSLKESGFTNINTQEITTGWAKGNSVIGVTVNNKESYDSSMEFDPDAKIVVKYSSDDRIEVTHILENWKDSIGVDLQDALIKEGFLDVDTEAIETYDESKNGIVESVFLNGEKYIAGDCYLQKAKPIEIKYFVLQINIGQKASYFKNKDYKDIVSELKNKGFSNIRLIRSDDLINGILKKEGKVKKITIGGEEKFDADVNFPYDAEITITVNTYKNKGCEEITDKE